MIITRVLNFPDGKATSFCICDANGDYNIYINARASVEEQIEGYLHELKHITRNDFDNNNVQLVESEIRAS